MLTTFNKIGCIYRNLIYILSYLVIQVKSLNSRVDSLEELISNKSNRV